MKTKYNYVYFLNVTEDYPKLKTKVYECRTLFSNNYLGTVKWFGRWRQYCIFFDNSTIFNSICLEDVVDFLKQLNKEHKEKKDEKNNSMWNSRGKW